MTPIRTILTALIFTTLSAFARDAAKANEALLHATSPFEDIVEFALDKNDASIAKMLITADGNTAAVREALPAAALEQFNTLLAALHKAATDKAHHAVALNSVELFRVLIDNLDSASLKVPKEVSLLDYVGFKLHVLEAAPPPDWNEMRKTAADAGPWWDAIKSKLTDRKLGDAFNTTVRGLQQAAKTENLPMLHFAAQIDLDLVDLLEKHFEAKK